ncbi:peptidase S14 [Terrihabitans rhizophilus]|uniref:Peptidase S14 n=1 Tax=Terrihabitans rhizophilus TaxID=3092662 RepID=A0ABU4RNM1_9HYPH|nr:peptidase S14 [Terrihabitans sp. PJ23]MDX6805689.1 peptidase S14 [Terrihabitans sp. PJ23]
MQDISPRPAPDPGVDPATLKPNIRLFGSVDEAMLAKVLDGISALPTDEPLVMDLTTMGGDADIGRRIALEVRIVQDSGRPAYFLGKSSVFSAGVTIMGAFPASSRFLDRDCVLLIHERRIEKQIAFSGPLRSNLQMAHEFIAQLESGIALQEVGFRELIRGTNLSMEELRSRVSTTNWYVPAAEALELGLVAGLF